MWHEWLECNLEGQGGDPDTRTVAKMVLNDWLRGKLPFFTPPPGMDKAEADAAEFPEGPLRDEDIEAEASNPEDEAEADAE